MAYSRYISLLISSFMALMPSMSEAANLPAGSKPLAVKETMNDSQRSKIKSLLRQEKYKEALEAATSAGAATGFLDNVYLSVLESTQKPLVYSLPHAKHAVKLKGDDACARTNLGILLQRNGERAAAVEQYRKATQLDPTGWRARVGIAQCLSTDGVDGMQIAERELSTAVQTPENSLRKWSFIGSTYLVLRKYKEAQACFEKLLKVTDDTRAVELLLKAQIKQNANGTINSAMLERVIQPSLTDRGLAVAIATLPDQSLSDQKRELLLDICAINFVGTDELFYDMARSFEALGKNSLAARAYLEAHKNSPQSARYMLSLIANRVDAGDIEGARDYASRFVPAQADAVKKKPPKDAFAHTLGFVPQFIDESANPLDLHVFRAVYRKINCGCRIAPIEHKLRSLPGVVYAGIVDVKEPPLTVIYQASKVGEEAIVSAARRQDDVFEIISDETVKSLPAVVKLIQQVAAKPDRHSFTIWSFEPPPMELP